MVHQARRATEFGLRIPVVEVDFKLCSKALSAFSWSHATVLEKAWNPDNPKLLRAHAKIEGREGNRFRVRLTTT
jgi:hypothetical protein